METKNQRYSGLVQSAEAITCVSELTFKAIQRC